MILSINFYDTEFKKILSKIIMKHNLEGRADVKLILEELKKYNFTMSDVTLRDYLYKLDYRQVKTFEKQNDYFSKETIKNVYLINSNYFYAFCCFLYANYYDDSNISEEIIYSFSIKNHKILSVNESGTKDSFVYLMLELHKDISSNIDRLFFNHSSDKDIKQQTLANNALMEDLYGKDDKISFMIDWLVDFCRDYVINVSYITEQRELSPTNKIVKNYADSLQNDSIITKTSPKLLIKVSTIENAQQLMDKILSSKKEIWDKGNWESNNIPIYSMNKKKSKLEIDLKESYQSLLYSYLDSFFEMIKKLDDLLLF